MKITHRVWALMSMLLATNLLNADDAKPIKALLITGGGYHDYATQKVILTEGISARANVEWTIVLENPGRGQAPKIYASPDWIEGYDVVVHNECYSKYSDEKGVRNVVQAHLDAGVGVVMIHCAMHTFRDTRTKGWDELVGVESRKHGSKFPIVVRNLDPKHPITRNMPLSWTTPNGELYHTNPLKSATPLAIGYQEGREQQTTQVCVWANTYDECRIFGTTLGHHNETMREQNYLDLLTNGLLWSCRKLNDDGTPVAGYGKIAAITPHRVKFQVVQEHEEVLKFASAGEFLEAGLPTSASRAYHCCE